MYLQMIIHWSKFFFSECCCYAKSLLHNNQNIIHIFQRLYLIIFLLYNIARSATFGIIEIVFQRTESNVCMCLPHEFFFNRRNSCYSCFRIFSDSFLGFI